MQRIVIKAVPKHKIRNQGVGDYKQKKKHLEVLVSNELEEDEMLGVALHELVEALLVKKRGIRFREINRFDKKNINHCEPGNKRNAPYHKEHKFAGGLERSFLRELKK